MEAVDEVEEVGRDACRGWSSCRCRHGVVVPGAAERRAAGLVEEAERERPVAAALRHLRLRAGDPRRCVGVVAAQLRAGLSERSIQVGSAPRSTVSGVAVWSGWMSQTERRVGEPGQRAPGERRPAARVDDDLVEVAVGVADLGAPGEAGRRTRADEAGARRAKRPRSAPRPRIARLGGGRPRRLAAIASARSAPIRGSALGSSGSRRPARRSG